MSLTVNILRGFWIQQRNVASDVAIHSSSISFWVHIIILACLPCQKAHAAFSGGFSDTPHAFLPGNPCNAGFQGWDNGTALYTPHALARRWLFPAKGLVRDFTLGLKTISACARSLRTPQSTGAFRCFIFIPVPCPRLACSTVSSPAGLLSYGKITKHMKCFLNRSVKVNQLLFRARHTDCDRCTGKRRLSLFQLLPHLQPQHSEGF